MRLLGVFLVHEAKILWRSHALKIVVAVYLVLCAAPAVGVFSVRGDAELVFGAATYADAISVVQPALTALLGFLLAALAGTREPIEGSLDTLGVAPITNSGYVLRRWLSVVALTLLMSLPPLGAGLLLSRAAGAPSAGLGPFLWPWLVHVVPVAAVVSAIGAGLAIIAGGPLRAAILGLLLGAFSFSIGNDVLARFGRHLAGAGEWLNMGSVYLIPAFFKPYFQYWVGPSSDALVDARFLSGYSMSRGALTAGIAAFLMGAAPFLLGRTRKDLRPWRIRPDHPLRTIIKTANDVRQALAPEPSPAPADRVALLCGVLVLTGSLTYVAVREERYRARGMERFEAETSGRPAPTDPSVLPVKWAINGSFALDGRLRVRVIAEVKNGGSLPIEHLAFSLNPSLRVESLEAGSGTTTQTRIWDRLSVALTPPLAPGESRDLEFLVDGQPARDRLPLDGRQPFSLVFGSYLEARLSSQLVDLSRAYTLRDISKHRIGLVGSSLMPVPRYETWELTPPGKTSDVEGGFVPGESFFPEASITMDLKGPEGVVVADSCGDVSSPGRGGIFITGTCPFSPAKFEVRGGKLSRANDEGAVAGILVIPSHAPMAERHLPVLEEASGLAQRAWPEVPSLHDAVVLEWPLSEDPEGNFQLHTVNEPIGPLRTSSDRLILIDESTLLSERPLKPEWLAAELVARSLEHRRSVSRSEAPVFDHFWRDVAALRMGALRSGGAMVRRREARATFLQEPILGARPSNHLIWTVKLPALVAGIAARAGESGLTRGINAFLSDTRRSPGTVRELLDAIGREGGVSLESTYEDYFEGDALPVLSLEDVEFRKREGAWQATGLLRNLGTGEAICPLVLQTETGTIQTVVSVGPDAAEPFSLRSAQPPRTLFLDPKHRCYRYSPGVKVVEEVSYQETP